MIFLINNLMNKLKIVLKSTCLILSTILLLTTVAIAEQGQTKPEQKKVNLANSTSSAEQNKINSSDVNMLSLEATFFGNKEQPKVITIVPWQNPEQQRVNSKLISAQMSLMFEPVEVESLQRELQYYNRNR